MSTEKLNKINGIRPKNNIWTSKEVQLLLRAQKKVAKPIAERPSVTSNIDEPQLGWDAGSKPEARFKNFTAQQLSKVTSDMEAILPPDETQEGRRDRTYQDDETADRYNGTHGEGHLDKFFNKDREELKRFTQKDLGTASTTGRQRRNKWVLEAQLKASHYGRQLLEKFGTKEAFYNKVANMTFEEKVNMFADMSKPLDYKVTYTKQNKAQQEYTQAFVTSKSSRGLTGVPAEDKLHDQRFGARGLFHKGIPVVEWKGMEWLEDYIPKDIVNESNKDTVATADEIAKRKKAEYLLAEEEAKKLHEKYDK